MTKPSKKPGLDLPAFHARPPWWGGDLQTLRNKLVRPATALPGQSERLHLALADGSGDQLAAMLDTPEGPAAGPLVVLIHGLAGNEDSDYMRLSAAYHLSHSRRVLRLNLRGAGPSRSICGGQYHGACGPDIRDALLTLDGALLSNGLFLVGYSLGGNILINLLAADTGALPVRGAATVSAALDPAAAARRMMAPRNIVYHRWLLKRMKRECTAHGARLTSSERSAIFWARTIYDFDDKFIAPRNDFVNADDYYARTAGWRVVPEIRVPTLLIHARNDPWVPLETYNVLSEKHMPNIQLILTKDGGHVGFHASDHTETWYDRYIGRFLDSI